MEAELVRELPTAGGWQYEPKWDGFRGVVENLDGQLRIWSRNARPLLRYFPELRALGERLPPESALDGEIVIEREGRLDFDAMQTRLHPAESRIRRLSAEIPAMYVAFDVLLLAGSETWRLPLEDRRRQLETLPVLRSPETHDSEVAAAWLARLEATGFDGVIAKRLGVPYQPGSRDAVQKVKAHKSAECVLIGVRLAESDGRLATLLLGLHDDEGELRYVGSAAVAPSKEQEIRVLIDPLLLDAPDRRFSEPNRWGGGELAEMPVRPELVVEVRYDKWQGMRFRHGTRLLRFRPDKAVSACTVGQVDLHPGPGDPTVTSLLAAD